MTARPDLSSPSRFLPVRVRELIDIYKKEIAWHKRELEDLALLGTDYHESRIEQCEEEILHLHSLLNERNTDRMAKCIYCDQWSYIYYCTGSLRWLWLHKGDYCPKCERFSDPTAGSQRRVMRE